MKKIFALLLIGASYLTASSQEKGNFEIGFNGGFSLSTAIAGDFTNTSYRKSFNAGGFADYYFSDRWSLRAKLTYDQKGWDNGYITINGSSSRTDYRYDYLTIPIMANWHFGKKRNWYLNFGPYAGILLNASETAYEMDLKSFSQTLDAGVAVGIGVKFPLSDKVKFLIETDSQRGFTDIFKSNSGTTVNTSRSSLNLGLAFKI